MLDSAELEIVVSVMYFSTCRVKKFNSEHILFVTASWPRLYLTSATEVKLKRVFIVTCSTLQKRQRHYRPKVKKVTLPKKANCLYILSTFFPIWFSSDIVQTDPSLHPNFETNPVVPSQAHGVLLSLNSQVQTRSIGIRQRKLFFFFSKDSQGWMVTDSQWQIRPQSQYAEGKLLWNTSAKKDKQHKKEHL